MPFKIEIYSKDAFPVIKLKDESNQTTAEIYSFGALLNAFTVGSRNIIDGYTSPKDATETITNGFKSAKLSPFVCRISEGLFEFNGNQYKTGKFFLGKEAIHGLLYDAVFDITGQQADEEKAAVTLSYHYKSRENYVFDFTCDIVYTLEKNNRLTLQTTIKNKSNHDLPLCDGWHPYFSLGATINELSFAMNCNGMLEFSERLLPTGNILPCQQFQQLEKIGDTVLDNCFLLNDTVQPACVLKNNVTGMQLTIQPGEAYPYLQVYTPPHRKSIAIENLSSAPDAYNNKIGLAILAPQQEKKFSTGYIVTLPS
jgi:aldose 1-epimerase